MIVVLKPELEKFIAEQVRCGRYEAIGDAINAAVAHLQTERDFESPPLNALLAQLDIGLAEANRKEFVDFTAEDVIADRHAARRPRPHKDLQWA